MNYEEELKILEQTRNEVIRFTNELDEKLAQKQINGIEYHLLLDEKLGGKTKQEILSYLENRMNAINNEQSNIMQKEQEPDARRRKAITISAAAIILIIMALIGIIYTNPGVLTGYTTATREVQGTIDYNRVFDHYTETQLNLENIIGLKISGTLEGTRAIAKLRIDGVDYVIADITNNQQNQITGQITEEPGYELTTDKKTYAIGETATITITPTPENYSLYINYGEETHKLDTNTYNSITPGEHQAITIIVLPNDIIRLETNFTVTEAIIPTENTTINKTNTTAPEINETTNETNATTEPTIINGYEFTDLCLETCNIEETSNPILIIEVEEGSKLTITNITTTETQENQAPTQTKTIPDITIEAEQTIELNLNQYFKDPEQDPIQYDINAIPEVTTTINQNYITINSQNTGTYTAYIYATDGDKLTTSNTFQITIGERGTTPIIPTLNETNQTTNETNTTFTEPITTDPCSNPDLNARPAYCYEGMEDKVFQDVVAPLSAPSGETVGRFNRFGNLIIRGLIVQQILTGEPGPDDFKIGYSEIRDFTEINTYTSWISKETGNLYLRGKLYEEQPVVEPPQNNVYTIQNKFGIILGYFDVRTGDLYLKGNIVQLGKI